MKRIALCRVAMEKGQRNRMTIAVLLTGLVLTIGGAALGWVILPRFIEEKIRLGTQLVNGSVALEKWMNVPYDIQLRVYIFNITNPDSIRNGEKIILEDQGPYVYREKRQKLEVELDETQDHIKYRTRTTFQFDPDASVGPDSDVLSILNVPLISVAHVARVRKEGFNLTLARTFVRLLTSTFANESLVERKPVREILFQGWKLNGFYQGIPQPEKPKEFDGLRFGIFRDKQNSDDGLYVAKTGRTDHSTLGEIVSWEGKRTLPYWPGKGPNGAEDSVCNQISGSDGSLFPPFLTKKSVLRLYSSDACRSFHLKFHSDTVVKSIPTYRFKLPRETFASPMCNENNTCFCQKQSSKVAHHCTSKGITRLFSCKHGAPVVASNPHFLHGSDDLFEPFEMSLPNEEDHETFIDIEPTTGVVLRARKRFQLNVELQRLPGFSVFNDLNFENLTDNPSIILPVVWAEEYVEISNEFAAELRTNLMKSKVVVEVVKWTSVALGFAVCAFGGMILNSRSKDES